MIRTALLIVLTPLIILSASIWYYAFNAAWYEHARNLAAYPEYGSVQKAKAVFTYVQTGDSSLLIGYDARELTHLADIYKLITQARIVTIVIFVILLATFIMTLEGQGIGKTALSFSIATAGFTVLLLVLANISSDHFESIFVKFHEIFFHNNFWQLDPNTETLIWTFPPDYFYYTVRQIGVTAIVCSVSTSVISHLTFWQAKQKIKK